MYLKIHSASYFNSIYLLLLALFSTLLFLSDDIVLIKQKTTSRFDFENLKTLNTNFSYENIILSSCIGECRPRLYRYTVCRIKYTHDYMRHINVII